MRKKIEAMQANIAKRKTVDNNLQKNKGKNFVEPITITEHISQ